jgi:type II secretory pathway pseudopilin PulG
MMRRSHGFALLDLLFVCGIIGLIAAIAMPKLLIAKQAAGSASAIASLRVINSSQLAYALTCGNGFYAPDLPRLGVVPPGSNEAFIAPDLSTSASPVKSGYTIRMTATPFSGAPASCNGLAAGEASEGFKAGADPIDPMNTRFFGSNSYQRIYENSSSLFGAMPESGEPDPSVGDLLR